MRKITTKRSFYRPVKPGEEVWLLFDNFSVAVATALGTQRVEGVGDVVVLQIDDADVRNETDDLDGDFVVLDVDESEQVKFLVDRARQFRRVLSVAETQKSVLLTVIAAQTNEEASGRMVRVLEVLAGRLCDESNGCGCGSGKDKG